VTPDRRRGRTAPRAHVFVCVCVVVEVPGRRQWGYVVKGRDAVNPWPSCQPQTAAPPCAARRRDLAAYMQLLYAAVDRQFKISIQGRVVKRGKAFEMGVLKKKSHVFKKRFPIHFEKDVKGLDRNATDVARLIFGFSEELARDFNCGVCIYWRNRMITSFDTMDMMNEKDFGIIGIASTGNILNPTNNKQEFVDNLRNFQLTEEWIRDCFRDYKEEFFGEQIQAKTEQHDIEDTWAFCDSCGKSRRLPRGVSVPDDSHEQWFCWYLPKDNAFFGCEAPQEEEKPTEVPVAHRVMQMRKAVL